MEFESKLSCNGLGQDQYDLNNELMLSAWILNPVL